MNVLKNCISNGLAWLHYLMKSMTKTINGCDEGYCKESSKAGSDCSKT